MWSETTVWHKPQLVAFPVGEDWVVVDGSRPQWGALNSRGLWCLEQVDGEKSFGQILAAYAVTFGLSWGQASVHLADLFGHLERAGILKPEPVKPDPYPGRHVFGPPSHPMEMWLHANNSCNLSCAHCLVSSGPRGERGLSAGVLQKAMEEALALGVERFYITGGEPFLRPDLPELVGKMLTNPVAEVIILTNATLFAGPRRGMLAGLPRDRVRFQVSLDGARPETNDPIRGKGSFEAALQGLRVLVGEGFQVSLTTVVTETNLEELPAIAALAREAGAFSYHLMWPHRRGRALASGNGFFPDVQSLVSAVLETAEACRTLGIPLDNLEAFRRRVDGPSGIKYDLGNAGWESFCLGPDGGVYPSAALWGEPLLAAGRFPEASLAEIWRQSPVFKAFRQVSVTTLPHAQQDPLRFYTGGGDLEHAFAFGLAQNGGRRPLLELLSGPDPYDAVYRALIGKVWEESIACAKTRLVHGPKDVPRVWCFGGERSVTCGSVDAHLAARPFLTTHSNCVLSFDVDKPRSLVRAFYSRAAETPQPELCCPTTFDPKDLAHIPQEVVERFYGCGSPVEVADLKPGEVFVDLGSGAGIDVFIAAKKVGPEGRAIGVDMTEAMLEVARRAQGEVAQRLGYDAVRFEHGFLEAVPLPDGVADVVTSNCVVNLSPDKPQVFREVYRILKEGGRFVLADIVSDREIPPGLKTNAELWGECTVGALSEQALLAELERAGFFGLQILRKRYWKSVEGYPFFSLTVRAWKRSKSTSCCYLGHRAVYLGPMKLAVDEEGHVFPRGVPVEVCADTASRLQLPPFFDAFAVLPPDADGTDFEARCCGGNCC
ncbi:MAG: methyltransferase domain-containing protein [Thermoanaerobaculum sp.]